MPLRRSARVFLPALALLALMCATEQAVPEAHEMAGWQRLPALPGTEGVAGPFAGEVAGRLLLAGGTNFVGGRPWNGGKKTWHDTVYALEDGAHGWRVAGRLPRPLAYGASVSWRGTVLGIGGGDADHHYPDVHRFVWRDEKIMLEAALALPEPSAYHAAVVGDGVLYVLGGQKAPDEPRARRGGWRLDLRRVDARWEPVEPWPGPGRLMAVAGWQDAAVYIIGGYNIRPGADGAIEREFLRDIWRLGSDGHWHRCADVPRPVVGTPSPALPVAGGRLVLFGWNDGTIGGIQPPESRPDFPSDLLTYETAADRWQVGRRLPFPGKVTPLVPWRGGCAIVSGEIQPGIRTPFGWVLSVAARSRLWEGKGGEESGR